MCECRAREHAHSGGLRGKQARDRQAIGGLEGREGPLGRVWQIHGLQLVCCGRDAALEVFSWALGAWRQMAVSGVPGTLLIARWISVIYVHV